MNLPKLWLTFFGCGLSKFAPGTIGSIAGWVCAYFLLIFADFLTLILLSLAIFIFSIKMIDEYEICHKHDASEIVIDEVCGVFLSIGIAFAGVQAQGLELHSALSFSIEQGCVFGAALIMFRVFDIAKPSIIGRCDRLVKGGLGVMLDDVLAGVFGGLSCVVGFGIYILFKG